MSESRSTGHRLRSGLWTPSDVGSAYEVEALPMQTGQNDACPWTIAGNGTTPPKHKRIVQNADESWSPDGTTEWAWRMDYMTFGMLDYWLSAFLPGGVETANVTVMTYTAVDAAVFYQALIKRPDFPGPDAQYAPGGWGNVIWRFSRGVQVFP